MAFWWLCFFLITSQTLHSLLLDYLDTLWTASLFFLLLRTVFFIVCEFLPTSTMLFKTQLCASLCFLTCSGKHTITKDWGTSLMLTHSLSFYLMSLSHFSCISKNQECCKVRHQSDYNLVRERERTGINKPVDSAHCVFVCSLIPCWHGQELNSYKCST